MIRILIRNYTVTGYEEIQDSINNLRQKRYVPWAMHANGRIVYAPVEESRGTPPNNTGLRPYDTEVSKHRRNLCHSKLGVIALDRGFSQDALEVVSLGIKMFLKKQDESVKSKFATDYKGFLSGLSGYNSFGRLYDKDINDPEIIWAEVIKCLQASRTTHARVETLLAIHDAVGFKIIVANKNNPQYNKDPLYSKYMSWKSRLYVEGEGQMYNRDGGANKRGWYGRDIKPEYSFQKNIYPPARAVAGNLKQSTLGFSNVQSRTRATDLYQRVNIEPRPTGISIPAEASGNVYYEQLDLRNELYGAGPSGTVCGALAAAFTFGGFNEKGELFKEYLFAIIGYLVGGGMHSLHEVLSPLRLLGLEYNTGSLLGYDFNSSPAPDNSKGLVRAMASNNDFPLLPQKFLKSKQFEEWRDEYYDVVVLGGIHWQFNDSSSFERHLPKFRSNNSHDETNK